MLPQLMPVQQPIGCNMNRTKLYYIILIYSMHAVNYPSSNKQQFAVMIQVIRQSLSNFRFEPTLDYQIDYLGTY